ncbi:MAG: hypothetical protein J6Q22_10600 [Prevotella sp.]|nr:hypothetical protein [Prevotella sp.]
MKQGMELVGDYCVVVRMNGRSEIRKLKDVNSVFEEAKEIIGCKWLDHARIQQISPDVVLEFLVNDEGYIQWGNNPKKVNPIGTFFYNGGSFPDHYILGDIVMCLELYTEDGGDFMGMSEAFATRVAMHTNQKIKPLAEEICPIPDRVPDPVVKVSSYATLDDMVKAMKGDKSIKPTEETMILGRTKDEEKKTEDN